MIPSRNLPFLLHYEEEPTGDSLLDGLDEEYLDDRRIQGKDVRVPFVPWDISLTLLPPEI